VCGVLGAPFGLQVEWSNLYPFVVIAYFIWVPIEAGCISVCGTTPGKMLFNIQVLNESGRYLGFPQSLGRAFAVLVAGEGLLIPLLSTVTAVISYRRLKRLGVTRWDHQFKSVVRHEKIGLGRVICILIFFSLLILACLSFIPKP